MLLHGFAESPLCELCGGAEDTPFHRAWECSATAALRSEHELGGLALRAQRERDTCPVWTTGWLPCTAVPTEPPHAQRVVKCAWFYPEERRFEELGHDLSAGAGSEWSASEFGQSLRGARRFYLDGSGLQPKHASLRRAGWGVAWRDSRARWGAFYGPLVGPQQTVPRAELTALRELLTLAQPPLVAVSDCQNVVDGFTHPTPAVGKVGSGLEDLWRDVRTFRAEPRWDGDAVTLEKVRAHQTLRAVELGRLSLEDWRGNDVVDRVAKRAAAIHAVPESVAARHRQELELASRVAAHFARVLVLFARESPPRRRVRKRRAAAERRPVGVTAPRVKRAGRHCPVRQHGRWECVFCAAHATTKAYATKLAGLVCRGSARAQAAAAGRDRVLAGEPRRAHDVRERAGLDYCARCGAWSCGKKTQGCRRNGASASSLA